MAKLFKRKNKKDKAREARFGRHSPAGYAWLMEEKRKTEPTYFRGIKWLRRKTTATQLRDRGISEEELKTLGLGKKLKKKK